MMVIMMMSNRSRFTAETEKNISDVAEILCTYSIANGQLLYYLALTQYGCCFGGNCVHFRFNSQFPLTVKYKLQYGLEDCYKRSRCSHFAPCRGRGGHWCLCRVSTGADLFLVGFICHQLK